MERRSGWHRNPGSPLAGWGEVVDMEASIFLVERPVKRPGSRQQCPTDRLQMLSPVGLGRKGNRKITLGNAF